jgi:parvulin-like peptidyl-prolyl isomerase
MHGKPDLRWAVLGFALCAWTAVAQTPPPASKAGTDAAVKLPMPATVSPTAVAATVNGEPIYEVAVQRGLERVAPARRADVRPTIINDLADHLIIEQSLRAAGYKVEAPEIDKRIADMKAEMKKANRDFDKMLAEVHVTEAELRQHIAADLRWLKYANAQVTGKTLHELYDKNKDVFDGSAVQAWHILLAPAGNDDKAAAAVQAQLVQIKKDIETEVEAGLAKLPANTDKLGREKARANLIAETFAKYAKQKSECPSKSRGGYVGWFQKVGFMTPAFAEAAFALPTNQISNVVKTPFGYHLIMVSERKPGKDIKFDDVKESVKEFYFERLHDSLAAQLRPKAKLVVNPAPK